VDHNCHNEERIRSLENDRTESKVYIKQINENISEIKQNLRGLKSESPSNCTNPFWQSVIMELFKLLTTLIAILGALFGFSKIIK